MQLRPDLWISEASVERLAPGRYIARIKVETAEETRIDMWALPLGYDPARDRNQRALADAMRDHYMREDLGTD